MINWGALGLVGVVSLAVSVGVVVLVALPIVGLSAREHAAAGTGTPGTLSPREGTAVGGLCLLAVALLVGYGLYVIVS